MGDPAEIAVSKYAQYGSRYAQNREDIVVFVPQNGLLW